jgi:hypothetical protein
MHALDPLITPLSGLNLIEASAGARGGAGRADGDGEERAMRSVSGI